MIIIIIKLLVLPIWLLSGLVPRKENLWIFGSFSSEKYIDNSKVFFEYINKEKNGIKTIWLTKNNTLRKELKKNNFISYHTYSFYGFYYSLLASKIIVSWGKNDINRYVINGAKLVNLWHGSPLKSIGLDNSFLINKRTNFIKKYFFSYLYEYTYDYIISPSNFFNQALSSAFDIEENKIFLNGYPRTDLLFDKENSELLTRIRLKFPNCKIILYLPTFRDNDLQFNPFMNYDFNIERFQSTLIESNSVLLYKGHSVSSGIKLPSSNRIMNFSGNEDLNLILKDVDVLLTDYSSAIYDFFITKKPIILAPFDFKDYLQKDRQFYYNYYDIFKNLLIGENWREIEFIIKDINYDINYDYDPYNKYNSYFDSNNCDRLFDFLGNK